MDAVEELAALPVAREMLERTRCEEKRTHAGKQRDPAALSLTLRS